MKRLITGGCGFIGSHLVRLLTHKYPNDTIVNLDKLTYAGKLENVADIESDNYHFVQGDICDEFLLNSLFQKYSFDYVYHLAAESHVDNSIVSPRPFLETNVMGTMCLLQVAFKYWQDLKDFQQKRFLQVSTDEVYGSVLEGSFSLTTQLNPSSPYSSSKAAGDLLALSYFKTYGFPVLVSRCSNNFGPNQDYEKLIPLIITNALQNKKLPVYGDGSNVRDWIYVVDHCTGLEEVMTNGRCGQTYLFSGGNEITNLTIVKKILNFLKKPHHMIEFVPDRLGHDFRYSLDSSKTTEELGWQPKYSFDSSLKETINWYLKALKFN